MKVMRTNQAPSPPESPMQLLKLFELEHIKKALSRTFFRMPIMPGKTVNTLHTPLQNFKYYIIKTFPCQEISLKLFKI
jgi:hypothetical protein